MKNLGSMMKQAQAMQAKMAEAQAKLEQMTVEGASGGGMVNVILSGKGEMKGVTIDPALIDPDDAEVLEDLIVAAHNDAKAMSRACSICAALPAPFAPALLSMERISAMMRSINNGMNSSMPMFNRASVASASECRLAWEKSSIHSIRSICSIRSIRPTRPVLTLFSMFDLPGSSNVPQ